MQGATVARPARTSAAVQTQTEPLTTYFRKIFSENRKLLKTRSNEEVLRRWQDEHPARP
jgi:hypothetical protein